MLGDKGDKQLIDDVEKSVADLKASLEGEDLELIKENTTSLSSKLMKVGEAAYKENQAAQEPENNKDENQKNDNKEDVVDADFEEVKSEDDKKNAS